MVAKADWVTVRSNTLNPMGFLPFAIPDGVARGKFPDLIWGRDGKLMRLLDKVGGGAESALRTSAT